MILAFIRSVFEPAVSGLVEKALRNLLGIFWNPSAVFARLLEQQRAALTVFVILGGLWAAHWATNQRVDVQAMQRQVAADLGADGMGYPGLGIGLPMLLLVFSLLFYLLLATWRKGVRFKQVFRLMAHAWLPLALRQLLSIPVIYSYPSIHPERTHGLFKTDLASLAGLEQPLLGLVEPFALWCGALMYLAARVCGRGRLWSALVSLPLALAMALVFGKL